MAEKSKMKRMLKLQKKKSQETVPSVPQAKSYMDTECFRINYVFTPPYNVLIDTNFINFCIKRKLDLRTELLNCLLSNTELLVTDCVIGELEKLGRIYRVALAMVKKPEFRRLECDHSGTYVDDCLVRRVRASRCYILATCDTELKNSIRKIQGVPLLYIQGKKFVVERLPNASTKIRR